MYSLLCNTVASMIMPHSAAMLEEANSVWLWEVILMYLVSNLVACSLYSIAILFWIVLWYWTVGRYRNWMTEWSCPSSHSISMGTSLLHIDIVVLSHLPSVVQSTSINQSNVFIKPFLHQLMSQSAVQKPRLKPQTASNAGVDLHGG